MVERLEQAKQQTSQDGDGVADLTAHAVTLPPALAPVRAGDAKAVPLREADRTETLVRRCQQGDRLAFREIFRLHQSEVGRIVFRVIGPSSELDDVVQEVFFQVHRSIAAFRGQSRFTTWLHRVAVNVALQHIRRKRTSLPAATVGEVPERPVAPGGAGDPLAAAMSRERLAAVYRVLEGLSDKKRVVLVLHDLQGMTAGDIAELLRIPVLTVRTRLFYARREFYGAIATEPTFGQGWNNP